MKQSLYLLCLFLLCSALHAQRDAGLVLAAPDANPSRILVKWLTPAIINREGYNLYRRSVAGGDWELLNDTPLTVGVVPLDEALVAADSSLRIARDLALRQDFDKLPALAKVNFLTATITVPAFARFLGVQYEDATALPGARYEYEVRALAGGGERAVGKSPAVGLADDFGLPPAPALSGEYNKTTSVVDFGWDHDPESVFAYHLDRIDPVSGGRLRLNERPVVILNSTAEAGTRYSDPTPGNAQSYRYELAAIDYFGRVSPKTSFVEVELPDLLPPQPPTDPASDNSVDGQIGLSWRPSPDADVVAYRIARTRDVAVPAQTVARLPAATLSYLDEDLPGYGYYYYELYAIDGAGNESPVPLYHIANASDLYPPAPPRGVRISAESGKISLDWQPNREGDLAGYIVMQSMDVKGTGTWAALQVEPFAETTFENRLAPERRNTMIYHVVAMDTSGNRSEPSEIVRIAMPDEVPPPVPFLQSVSVKAGDVALEWQAVTEKDMRGYRLERGIDGAFTVIAQPEKGKTTYTDSGQKPGARLEYRLSSVDTTGNVSVPSRALSVTIPRAAAGGERFALEGKYRKRDEGVVLEWAAAPGKTFVFRRRGESGRFQPLDQEITANKFIDKPGESGRYDYFVKTYYPDGSRAESEVLTVVIK